MKKSKKVLLSAAIAAAIMGSVSLPQIQAANIGSGVNLKATSTGIGPWGEYDVKTTDKNLNTTLATQEDLIKVNSELAGKANDIEQNKNDIKDIKDNMKDSLDKAAQATTNANSAADKANSAANDAQVAAEKATNNALIASDAANDAINAADNANQAADKANSAANDAQVAAEKATNNALMASDAANDAINAADKANQAADNIKSDLDKKVDKTQYNWDKAQTNAAVQETKDTLNTFKKEQDVNNQAQRKDIEQNKQDIKANAAAADKAQKTADSKVDQSKYNWDKAQTNAAVQETKDTLNTFKKEQDVNNQAQRKDIEQNKQDIKANAAATNKAQADATKANYKADTALKVTGNGVLYNHATNLTDGVNQNTSAITKETNDRVAADTVLSNRITENSSAIQSLRHDVSDLGTEIDNVGAISAALAGLHPLDWNGSGSKFQLSAAAGTYDGKQAMALGGFYHPNRNMMLSLGVSSSFGSDRKTAGNVGITFRVGKGSNGTVSDDVAERLAAMDQKISQLESQNQKLTSMLAIVDPSLTKEFPDVPANHWAYEAVSKLAGNDIIEGYPDGDFHGDRAMTRYEIAQVIYKALKKGGTVDQKLVKEFNKEIEAVKANNAQ